MFASQYWVNLWQRKELKYHVPCPLCPQKQNKQTNKPKKAKHKNKQKTTLRFQTVVHRPLIWGRRNGQTNIPAGWGVVCGPWIHIQSAPTMCWVQVPAPELPAGLGSPGTRSYDLRLVHTPLFEHLCRGL